MMPIKVRTTNKLYRIRIEYHLLFLLDVPNSSELVRYDLALQSFFRARSPPFSPGENIHTSWI